MRCVRGCANSLWMAGLTGLWMALAAPPAEAQSPHRCVAANGQRYTSNAPCPPTRRPQGPVYYGPTHPQPIRPTPLVPLERAPEELGYMSPECASMREGIRTAPARGVDSRTQAEARRNFQELCSEDHARARRELMDDKRLQQREIQQERQQASERKTLAKADQDKLMAQCAEMRGAIRQRRARTGMSEGELRDLQLFEQRYETRCVNAGR